MSTSRGAALPAAMLTVVAFVIMIAGAYSLLRLQVRETVYQVRLAQAQAIAEAGLEAALNQVSLKPSWKAGYNQKAFAGGYFTVSLSTDQSPIVTATGYSAPIPIIGRAARTVTATALLDGFYDFADSTFTLNWYATAFNSAVADKPTCSISNIQTLGPTTAAKNGCLYGLYALANDTMFISSSATNPIHWSGNAAYAEPASTAPFTNAVKGSAILAASSVTVAVEDGSPYLTENDNNSTRINPFTAYDPATMILHVTTTTGNVTLSSGTFYFTGLIVDSSTTLTIGLTDTSQAAFIYLAGNLDVPYKGVINGNTGDCGTSASKGGCKAYNAHIYGQGGGTMTLSGFTNTSGGFGVHSTDNFTYLDLFCPMDVIVINQRFLGRVVGSKVTINNPYGSGNTRPVFFFDTQFGYTASEGVRWVSGSWSESYYKP